MKHLIFIIGLVISIPSPLLSIPEIFESSSHEAVARYRGRVLGLGTSEGEAYAAALAKVPLGAKVIYKGTSCSNKNTKNERWGIWLTWEKE